MKIFLKKLVIEGFRSFKSRQEILFPTSDSVILIDGYWKYDPKIKSGAGKSSVLEALAFCLDISDLSVSAATHWNSKKMYLQLDLLVGDLNLTIIRDPKLSLTINGILYESQVTGAKEKLKELIGVSSEMLKAISYRKQRVKGRLIRSTDSEIKEFLSQSLGLEEIENAVDLLVAESTALEKDISEHTSTLSLKERQLEMYNIPQTSLDSQKDGLEILQNQIQELEAQQLSVKTELNSLQQQLTLSHADQTLRELIQEERLVTAEIVKINILTSNIQAKTIENQQLRILITNLRDELAQMVVSLCPTCHRDWQQGEVLKKQKEDLLEKSLFTFQSNLEYIKNANPIIVELPTLQSRLSQLNQQLGERKAPTQLLQQKTQNIQSQLHAITNSLNVTRNNLTYSYTQYNEMLAKQKRFSITEQEITSLKQEILQTKESLEACQLSKKMLDRSGFMGNIFDEILLDIQVRTNDMLANYPNAGHLTVEINANKLIKSKGISKKEITVTISNNGILTSLDEISGGQQAAVELCSDLAIAEVIRCRSSKSIQWVCLDEVMDGLGIAEKTAVVDMLKTRNNGLVLMIEHAPEIKDSFDNIITVEYDGKESNVINAR